MSDQKRKAPVGSRNRKGIRAEMQVPVNLERVLIEAGKDLAFYQALISDPARALEDRGYHLRASEQAMLSAMPQPALQKMIDQLRPEKLTKSRFAKQVATAVAGTLLFSSAACESEELQCGGVQPDWPADAIADSSGGIDPNRPNDASSESGTAGTGGTGGRINIEDSGRAEGGPDSTVDAGSTGTGGMTAGVNPDWFVDASVDGNQANDAEQPTWEIDGGIRTRGIAPDLPKDAANNSSDNENQGEN